MAPRTGPAVSDHVEQATRGVDLVIGFSYAPPAGESRTGLVITGALVSAQGRPIEADLLTFDPATGEITATWQEATTAKLARGTVYEARFVRNASGRTRVFYIRRVAAG